MNSNPSFEQSQLAKYTPPTSGGSTSAPKFDPSAPMPALPSTQSTTPSVGAGDVVNGIKTTAENMKTNTENEQNTDLNNLQGDVEGLSKTIENPVNRGFSGQAVKNIPSDLASIFKTGVGTVSDLSKFLLAPLTAGVFGTGINAESTAIGNTKTVQNIAMSGAGI